MPILQINEKINNDSWTSCVKHNVYFDEMYTGHGMNLNQFDLQGW